MYSSLSCIYLTPHRVLRRSASLLDAVLELLSTVSQGTYYAILVAPNGKGEVLYVSYVT